MWVQDSWQLLSNVRHIKQYKLQRKDYLAIAICDEDPLICHGRHPPPQLAMFSTTMPSIGGSSTNFPSSSSWKPSNISHAHAHTRLTALFHGLPGWVSTRKIKPVWILLKQETVCGRGISWAICKSATRSRQMTKPATHHDRPDAFPTTQPTASKHWRQHFTQTAIILLATGI